MSLETDRIAHDLGEAAGHIRALQAISCGYDSEEVPLTGDDLRRLLGPIAAELTRIEAAVSALPANRVVNMR